MKKLMITAGVLFAIALPFAITRGAEATPLYTSPLFVAKGDVVVCELASIGTSDIIVTIIVYDADGNEVATNPNSHLQAGHTAAAGLISTGNYYRCKVISNSSAIRVSIARFNGGSSDLNGYGQVK